MRRRRLAFAVSVISIVSRVSPCRGSMATVVEQETFTEPYCSTIRTAAIQSMSRASSRSTISHLRVGKNKAQSAFFEREALVPRSPYEHAHRRIVGPRANSTFHEVKATQVEGTVYEFTQLEAGQPFVVEDSSGRVVLRDRGVIRYHVVFDTGGDAEPGGEFVDFLGADVNGRHPGFDTFYCEIVGGFVGISDSSQRVTLHPTGTTASPLGYGEYLPPGYGEPGRARCWSSSTAVARAATARPSSSSSWPLRRSPPTSLSTAGRTTAVRRTRSAARASRRPLAVLGVRRVEFGIVCADVATHPRPSHTGLDLFHPHEVHDFITYAVSAYDVDPSRVYLTGLSCGGFGTWEYLAEYGNSQVAAAVPIAGEGRPAGPRGCASATSRSGRSTVCSTTW